MQWSEPPGRRSLSLIVLPSASLRGERGAETVPLPSAPLRENQGHETDRFAAAQPRVRRLQRTFTMSKYFKALDTDEGRVHVITKSRWMGFLPMPYTSVVPHKATDLSRLGTFIRWATKDPATLGTLHDAVVRLVEEVGVSGLADISNREKGTERVAKAMGLSWRDLAEEAAKSRAAIPVLDDVLKHVKRFM